MWDSYKPWAMMVELYSDLEGSIVEERDRRYRAARNAAVFMCSQRKKCIACGFVPGPNCASCGQAIEEGKVGIEPMCQTCTAAFPG